MNIIAQVSHLLMTANLALMLFEMFKLKDFRAAAIGLLLGTFIFSWFLAIQQNYVSSHPREMKELLGLDKILWNPPQELTNR
jgi:ABC-type transport system involved in cytochrome c biogenesis permease component